MFAPARAGRPEQDSNLSEPGGRAVSHVRSCEGWTPRAGFEPQRARRASGVACSLLRGLDAPSRIRTSASPEGERCRMFAPARAGRPEQDSNLSEPGGRAVSHVRSCEGWTPRAGFEPQRARRASGVACSLLRGLDAPSRIRTSASPEGERCRMFAPARAGRPEQDSNLSEPGGRAVSHVRSCEGWTPRAGFEPATYSLGERAGE